MAVKNFPAKVQTVVIKLAQQQPQQVEVQLQLAHLVLQLDWAQLQTSPVEQVISVVE